MKKGVNKVIILGNCVQDPDTKTTQDGKTIVNISIATNESWKDKTTGEKKERVEYHRVVFFNRIAEIAAQYLSRGAKVYIEGALRTRKWQDKEGQDRYTTEIVANELQMLDSRPKGGDQQGNHQAAPQAPSADSWDESAIPF